MSIRLKPIAVALVIAAAVAPAPLSAQAPQQSFGDWWLRCEDVGDDSEQCALTQYVVAEDREGIWLRAFVFRPTDGSGTVRLSILVPLQVILTEGLEVRLEGMAAIAFEFITCSLDGCLVSVELNENLMTAFGSGGEALFIVYFNDSEGVGIPVSLQGFAEGLTALP